MTSPEPEEPAWFADDPLSPSPPARPLYPPWCSAPVATTTELAVIAQVGAVILLSAGLTATASLVEARAD
jgi:hypothetical protein